VDLVGVGLAEVVGISEVMTGDTVGMAVEDSEATDTARDHEVHHEAVVEDSG